MIYEYQCNRCSSLFTLHRAVSQRCDRAVCECGGVGSFVIGTPPMIANSDSFPSHDCREGKFWQPRGRRLYMKERDYLEREAADDAAAAPDTCQAVAARGGTADLLKRSGM